MDSYHEKLLKHTCINQSQFNLAYKSKYILTTFPTSPPVVSTFVQVAWLYAQRRSKKDQRDANGGNTFGTKEDSNQPQGVTFNDCLVNVTTFEKEYQDHAPLKRATEVVFVEALDLYTKQMTDNLTTWQLQK